MKIVFFLGKRQLENYSLHRVKDREKYWFVAIVFTGEKVSLSSAAQARFDFIHELPRLTEGLLAEFNTSDVLQLLQDYIKNKNPKKIALLCQDEANILVAASIRTKLNLSTGPKLTELRIFRDKMLMKQCMEEHQIRTPKYLHYESSYSYSQLVERLGNQLIFKPTSSAGSLGVYKVSSAHEYEQFIKEQALCFDQYEVEEFIEGDLYHCDFAIHDQKILFLECAVCSCPNLDFQFGKPLGSMAIAHTDLVFEDMTAFAKKCLHAFGMPGGCFHLEVFLNRKQEMIFLEVGARAPGLLVPKMYEKATGQNILDVDLQAQSGCNSSRNKQDPSLVFG